MKESSIKTSTSATACTSLASPPHKMLTCTSGCRLEVWLNRAWVAGRVEGDGEDYWLFADTGGRFLLAEHMKARYTEHRWRSGVRDSSGICSSPSIRLMSAGEPDTRVHFRSARLTLYLSIHQPSARCNGRDKGVWVFQLFFYLQRSKE
jgi:Domain of unknown function (DUF5348)